MKGKVKISGNGLHIMVKKSEGFSDGDEVLVQLYDKSKDTNKCQYDLGEIKEAVKEAIAEERK